MKRGTPAHPKTYELASLLGVRHAYALGYLELLFHFTAQYAPEGNIGRYSDKRIAAALEWPSSPARLVEALVTSGWVDRDQHARLLTHDWHDHADRTTLQRLARSGKSPRQTSQVDTGKVCTQSEPDTRTPPSLSLSHSHKPEPSRDASAGWSRFEQEYPGELIPDRDCRVWFSVIHSPQDEAVLFGNLPDWLACRKFRDGFAPSAQKFLFEGHWKTKPRPDVKPESKIDRAERELEEQDARKRIQKAS